MGPIGEVVFVVEQTHFGSNIMFDICAIFTDNYSFRWRRHPRRRRGSCGDFVNLNIKLFSLSDAFMSHPVFKDQTRWIRTYAHDQLSYVHDSNSEYVQPLSFI